MSDNNVVNLDGFRERHPRMVWECACGSQLFMITSTYEIVCGDCNAPVYHLRATASGVSYGDD